MSAPAVLRHVHLPDVAPFAIAQSLQNHLASQFLSHKAIVSSRSPPSPLPRAPFPTILTFAPSPVYTTGRREHENLSQEQLNILTETLIPLQPSSSNPKCLPERAEVVATLRGGQTTFHGPGQLVVYPILDLRQTYPIFPKGISPRCYVHLLEQTTINTLHKWGLKGIRTENPGVWQEDGEKKVAALGVHLRRNITSYGVGLNVVTDLRWFDRITACGLEGKSVTSMLQMGADKAMWGTHTKRLKRWEKKKILGEDYSSIGAGKSVITGEYVSLDSSHAEAVESQRVKEGEIEGHLDIPKDPVAARVRLKPGTVARVWVTEFAKGLYGEEYENVLEKIRVTDLVRGEDGFQEVQDLYGDANIHNLEKSREMRTRSLLGNMEDPRDALQIRRVRK